MSLKLGLGHWATAPAALLGTTLVACAFGWISLRATGLGFLMLTLALSQVLWGTAYRWVSVTDGDNGLRGLTGPRPSASAWTMRHLSTTSRWQSLRSRSG